MCNLTKLLKVTVAPKRVDSGAEESFTQFPDGCYGAMRGKIGEIERA
ncbi:hypothetical protein [Lysinibacillus fusiformis]